MEGADALRGIDQTRVRIWAGGVLVELLTEGIEPLQGSMELLNKVF